MSLKLTGKGSILDTVANATVAGVKDVGDLASAGLDKIVGNSQGADQSLAAIKSNDQNLSGENVGSNISGLGSDLVQGGVNPIARPVVGLGIGLGEDVTGSPPQDETGLGADLTNYASDNGKIKNLGSPRQLLGNAIQTGVNVATLGKGSTLEGAVEGGVKDVLGNDLEGRVVGRVVGGAATGAAIGAGYGTGTAVASAKTPGEAVKDIATPAVQIGAIGGVAGLASEVPDLKENATPLDEVGGINNRPVPKPSDLPEPNPPENAEELIAQNNPLNPTPPVTPDTVSTPEGPEPDPEEMMAITQNVQDDLQQPIDFTKVGGANQELNQTINTLANHFKQRDLASRAQPTDLYKQIKAQGGIARSYYEDIPLYLKNSKGTSLDEIASNLGYKSDAELHDAILREREVRGGGKPTVQDPEGYKEEAKAYIAAHPQEFDNVIQRAKAEKDIDSYLKADKTSGYSKAKYQIPKGAPAKKFIQALWDKTHSPEHAAAMDVGAQLGDVRTTLKAEEALRDQSRAEYNKMLKNPPDPETVRAKAAELNSLEGRVRNLKNQETHYAQTYGKIRTQLDEKYPDFNLTAKKGVRLTTKGAGFETAKPVKVISSTPAPEAVPTAPPAPLSNEPGAPLTPETYAKVFGVSLDKAKADLAAEEKLEHTTEAPGRSIVGDRAILEGIKNGDSDAALVRGYMDATGVDEATATKAVGILSQNEHVDSFGNPENNPMYGRVADYEIGKAPEVKGLNKVLLTTKKGVQHLQTNPLINKALLRATGPGKLLEVERDLAKRTWDQLSPEDQALADKLRGNDIETVAKEAKDPQLFTEYATQAKRIEDTIHATRATDAVGDPTGLYRRNYGAGFHVADEKGVPTNIDQFVGKEMPWMKGRNFNNYEDVERASGLKRSTANFHEDVEKDVATADRYISTHSLANGLNEAFGEGAAHYGNTDVPADLKPLQEFTDGTGKPLVFARKDIADRINDRQQYQYRTDALGNLLRGYDSLNGAVKTLKLSFGGFHNINIGLSQAVLDTPKTLDTLQAWGSDPYYRAQLENAIEDGSLEKALHGGITLDAGAEFDKTGSALDKIDDMPGIKQLHSSLFQRQIPMSKLLVFQKYTKDLTLDKDYDTIRGVARVTNNVFGGINRMVDGMSASRLKLIGRAVLATDYNEGQIRVLLSALSKGGVEGRIARQMIGGRMALLAAPGTIQAIADKKATTPEQIAKLVGHQLFNPTIQTPWKTAGGNPKQIALLATVTNKFARAVEPALNSNNPDKLSGLKQELAGNTSALASALEEEYQNSDYYGDPMHGHGLTAAEDVGNLVNAAAPIPAQPVGRALENVKGLANNKAIQIVSGGQSAISPVEAGVDISGIGRGQANPDSPELQILNNRQLMYEGLPTTADKNALSNIHPSWSGSLTKAEENAAYANPNYEVNKWNSLRENAPDTPVYTALKKQNAMAEKNGEPGDPLLSLSAHDYKIVTEYEFLKHADEGPGANNTAAVMYSQNKAMIDKYETDENNYGNKMNALYNQSQGLKGSNEPTEKVGGAPQYTETPEQEKLANQYYAMTDGNSTSQQRAQFLTDNPELNQLFNAQFNAENTIRKQQGEPLLKPYPQASSALNDFMNTYTAASKADRATLRNDNPSSYTAMQNYLAQVDEYLVSETAGQANFQGQSLTQSNLKEIYDLGQYDIAPTENDDGTTTYSVNPTAAYNDSSSGSGSSGGSSTEVNDLINDLDREHAVETVKYMGRKAYIKKLNSHRKVYLPQPKHIQLKGQKAFQLPSQAKTKAKNTPIVV